MFTCPLLCFHVLVFYSLFLSRWMTVSWPLSDCDCFQLFLLSACQLLHDVFVRPLSCGLSCWNLCSSFCSVSSPHLYFNSFFRSSALNSFFIICSSTFSLSVFLSFSLSVSISHRFQASFSPHRVLLYRDILPHTLLVFDLCFQISMIPCGMLSSALLVSLYSFSVNLLQSEMFHAFYFVSILLSSFSSIHLFSVTLSSASSIFVTCQLPCSQSHFLQCVVLRLFVSFLQLLLLFHLLPSLLPFPHFPVLCM